MTSFVMSFTALMSSVPAIVEEVQPILSCTEGVRAGHRHRDADAACKGVVSIKEGAG